VFRRIRKANTIALCLALFLLAALPASGQSGGEGPTLNAPTLHPAGPTDSNLAVVAADFDEDGYDDLAVGNHGPSVSVLLNDGTGQLGEPRVYATSTTNPELAGGDFDGDDNLDLVTATYDATTVEVLLGDGTGAFRPGTSVDACNTTAVVAADFDADGRLDVALGGSCSIALLLGDGNGGFAPATYVLSGLVTSLEAGDVNVDGRPDLLGLTFGGAHVWLNDGSGGLHPPIDIATSRPRDVALGDLNADGTPDLVVGSDDTFSVSARLGDGTGRFSEGTTVQVALNPLAVRVVDFDGDGRLDVAALSWREKGRFQILYGDGSGGLEAGTAALDTVTCPRDLEVGDFDGDEVPDFAFADGCRPEAGLLLGRNVTATFDVCVRSAETGERFKAVTRVAPTDPAYGYWEYHTSDNGIPSGRANVVKRTARQIRLKVTNSSVVSLNAKFNLRTGVASITLKGLTHNQKWLLTTRDYADGGCFGSGD
jgi:hypothetical protein